MTLEDNIIMLKRNRDSEYEDSVKIFVQWASQHITDPLFADVALHKLIKIKELDADRKNLAWAIKLSGIDLEDYNN